jgi:hypothetical protein
MTKPRNGSPWTLRQTAGLLAAAALLAAGAAAALLDRGDIALAALIVANGVVLAGLLRLHRLQRNAPRSAELAALAGLVREIGEGAGRLERDVDALRERAEFSDQRLLAIVERERLLAEERHRELMRSIGAANGDAAPRDEPVRGGR